MSPPYAIMSARARVGALRPGNLTSRTHWSIAFNGAELLTHAGTCLLVKQMQNTLPHRDPAGGNSNTSINYNIPRNISGGAWDKKPTDKAECWGETVGIMGLHIVGHPTDRARNTEHICGS